MAESEKENRVNALALNFLERQAITPNPLADQIIMAYKEAYKQAEKDMQISLPSSLDKAADKYAEKHTFWLHTVLKECFRAGAEWTTRQGIVRVTSMMEDDLGDLCPVITDMRYLGFKPGDEVIVQIIKA